MRKNINEEHIEGRVFQHSLEVKVSGPASKNPGTQYISGNLDIAVDEEGLNVITVHFTYITETTKKGGKNQTFGVLKKIIDEPTRTWVASGKDNAFKVKVDTALGLNDFWADDNTKVSVKRNEGGFVSFVNELIEEENKRNIFTMDMVITRVTRVEADPERGIEEDYVKLGGAVFNFRNDLLPVEFLVRNETGMNYFESLEASSTNPIYTKLWGRIMNQIIKTEIIEESAFGDSFVVPKEKSTREWLVTGVAKIPYDFGDEAVMTREELTTAMQNREIHWADIKKNQEEYRAAKAAQTVQPAASIPPMKNTDFSF